MKKIIDYIKDLKLKLDFKTVLLGLVFILIILTIINILIPNSLKERIGLIPPQQQGDLVFEEEGDEPGYNVISDYVDKNEKQIDILSIMPYFSEQFNVTYEYVENKFTVTINPALRITPDDIYEWFESFPNIEDAEKLNIEFIDVYSKGPPTE